MTEKEWKEFVNKYSAITPDEVIDEKFNQTVLDIVYIVIGVLTFVTVIML